MATRVPVGHTAPQRQRAGRARRLLELLARTSCPGRQAEARAALQRSRGELWAGVLDQVAAGHTVAAVRRSPCALPAKILGRATCGPAGIAQHAG